MVRRACCVKRALCCLRNVCAIDWSRMQLGALAAAAVAGAVSAGEPADAQPRDSAAVVFVGHSLIGFDMPMMLEQMVESRGLKLTRVGQIIGGAPLRVNWDECSTACDAIRSGGDTGPYDVLVATDANWTIESNRIWNETPKYLEQFMELFLSRNPDARVFAYTSWEGLEQHKTADWVDAIDSELAQYELIAEQAEQLSAARGRNGRVDVLPSNLALRELIVKIEAGEIEGLTDRTDLFSDDVHLSPIGNYYIAAVVFSAIYDQTPEGVATKIVNQWGQIVIDVPPTRAEVLQR